MEAEPGDKREIRAARSESMVREINERLTQDDPLADLTGSHVIACECADPACVQTLAISTSQYAEIRNQPRHFAVLPGHIYSDVERVVKEFRTYAVVEKLGQAGETAEAIERETRA